MCVQKKLYIYHTLYIMYDIDSDRCWINIELATIGDRRGCFPQVQSGNFKMLVITGLVPLPICDNTNGLSQLLTIQQNELYLNRLKSTSNHILNNPKKKDDQKDTKVLSTYPCSTSFVLQKIVVALGSSLEPSGHCCGLLGLRLGWPRTRKDQKGKGPTDNKANKRQQTNKSQ